MIGMLRKRDLAVGDQFILTPCGGQLPRDWARVDPTAGLVTVTDLAARPQDGRTRVMCTFSDGRTAPVFVDLFGMRAADFYEHVSIQREAQASLEAARAVITAHLAARLTDVQLEQMQWGPRTFEGEVSECVVLPVDVLLDALGLPHPPASPAAAEGSALEQIFS